MKNKKLKGVGFNAKARLGHSKGTKEEVPDMLLPGEKGPSGPTLEIPENPKVVKMNAKKKKRMEAFIAKQLKKDARVGLYEKLAQNTFSSELLRSSKRLGTAKLSAKEKLVQALKEERAGVPRSDLSVPLVKEVHAGDFEFEEESEIEIPENVRELVENRISAEENNLSLLERAFGNNKGPEIFESSHHGVTKETKEENFGSALKQHLGSALKTTLGSALKSAPGSALKRKDKSTGDKESKKQKIEDSSDEDVTEEQKIWASNVVDGEKLEKSTKTAESKKTVLQFTPTPITEEDKKSSYHVPVNRTEEIQLARMSLPVVGEEQPIMETILANDVTILCGETGSGKTTQVPQFLYEAGFGDKKHPKYPGMIGITQPRRVAAVSMANRVADEMQLQSGQVSHQIRYDKGKTGVNTRIKFMTDGILLRELSSAAELNAESKKGSDLLLTSYSCIIIDEAHERTIGTDILIGWLTRIVALRNSGKIKGVKPLKLVIMSATLRVEDFTLNTTLFPNSPPPVIKVDGRQHKVVVHYNKRTPELDFMTEAFKKIVKIHTKLPHGGILVFVTGQQEVQILCKKLKKMFPIENEMVAKDKSPKETEDIGDIYDKDNADAAQAEGDFVWNDDAVDDFEEMVKNEELSDDEEEQVEILNGTVEDEDVEIHLPRNALGEALKKVPLHVLPLYSLLPTSEQMKIFAPIPEGSRLVVIATNVAETSLTIPGIKYVVDCGKAKERRYDSQTGIQNFQISWTSQASADQRAGRAGRLGPGHCYRLFSSAVFHNYFEKFSKPEILCTPIQGVVLSMKAMGMNQVVGFPFPTPPNRHHLKDAETLLKYLGAIGDDLKITLEGRKMAKFPVHPRYSKMLVISSQYGIDILPYIIAIVSGMSVGEIFVRDLDLLVDKKQSDDEEDFNEDEKEERKQKRGQFYKKMQNFSGVNPTSDMLMILRAVGAYIAESKKSSNLEKFCEMNFLRPKAMDETVKLMKQLVNIAKTSLNIANPLDINLKPPTTKQEALIRQALLAGYVDCVAKLDEKESGFGKHAVPCYSTIWSLPNEQFVIHPSSCIFRNRPAPKWIIYDQVQGKQQIFGPDGELLQLREKNTNIEKRWLKGVTVINEKWLFNQAKSLLNNGSFLEQPEPKYTKKRDCVQAYISPTFGPKLWPLPITEIDVENSALAASWFAKALLEGVVDFGLPQAKNVFHKLHQHLLTKPGVLSKSWAKNQPKVFNLLNLLIKEDVATQSDLLEKCKIYSYPNNPRVQKALIAAKYNNLDVQESVISVGKENTSAEFLAKFPLGKVPAFEGADGFTVYESNAIAYYVANQEGTLLLGNDEKEAALVQQWVVFADNEFSQAAAGWLYPIFGIVPYSEEATNKAKDSVKKTLTGLNRHLANRTFLVGERVTLADIVLVTCLYDFFDLVFDPAFMAPFKHVQRWYVTAANQPHFKAVLGDVKLCQKMKVAKN
ncbi:ATP-dependent RNA helicase dhx37 [Boothiomyces sp. JEL0866]|nr:ATP-dependent RNA helicase dhx37 [Boothiomyces sp. JEL0866]